MGTVIDEIFRARWVSVERTLWLTFALCGEPNMIAYPVSPQDRREIKDSLNAALPGSALEIYGTLLREKEKKWRRQMYTEMEVTTHS